MPETPDPQLKPVLAKEPPGVIASASAATRLLSAANLAKAFHGRKVVNDVSIFVNAGEVVGLLGPNGAGKTTTFNIIVGLVKPDAGEVRLAGREITKLPMHRRARLGIWILATPIEPSVFRRVDSRAEYPRQPCETCVMGTRGARLRLQVSAHLSSGSGAFRSPRLQRPP